MHKITLTYLLIFAALNMAFVIPTGSLSNYMEKESSIAIIEWNENTPLSWYDFKGKAERWNGISALTASAIEYSYDCYHNELDIVVKAIFIPDESWVKEEGRTDYILAHEQLHFDITEIFSRKLRQDLSREVRSCSDIWKIEQIARKVINEWKDVQHQYDKDSHHSINKELQALWKEKVDYDLNMYANYTHENWVLNN